MEFVKFSVTSSISLTPSCRTSTQVIDKSSSKLRCLLLEKIKPYLNDKVVHNCQHAALLLQETIGKEACQIILQMIPQLISWLSSQQIKRKQFDQKKSSRMAFNCSGRKSYRWFEFLVSRQTRNGLCSLFRCSNTRIDVNRCLDQMSSFQTLQNEYPHKILKLLVTNCGKR